MYNLCLYEAEINLFDSDEVCGMKVGRTTTVNEMQTVTHKKDCDDLWLVFVYLSSYILFLCTVLLLIGGGGKYIELVCNKIFYITKH